MGLFRILSFDCFNQVLDFVSTLRFLKQGVDSIHPTLDFFEQGHRLCKLFFAGQPSRQ
jgi:hypothetical protein